MSYTLAIAGVLERLSTIAGDGQALAYVINGTPTSAQAAPMAYTLFDNAQPITSNQVKGATYRVLIRCAVKLQDYQTAEDDLAALVDAVPAVFAPGTLDGNGHSYATLGDRVNVAKIASITSGYVGIGGVEHRIIDFALDITDKR